MRVARKRWGELTIKKQGQRGKNHFDRTKSFSIEEYGRNYKLEQYLELLKQVTDLTQDYDFKTLKKYITSIKNK